MENQLAQPIQTTQPLQPTPPIQPVIIPEKPKTNYWIISTTILALLLIGGLSWYLVKAKSNKPIVNIKDNGQTNSQNTTPIITENSTPTNQAKQDAGKVAFRMGGTIIDFGDIYVSDPNGSNKQKITKSGHIGEVYSWSPDNKYILASTTEKIDEFRSKSSYVLVNSQTGVESTIPIVRGDSGQSNSDFMWTGNNEITYLDEAVMYKVTIAGQKTEVWKVPKEAEAIFYHLNKLATKVAYDTGGPDFPENMINVFTYDISTGQKTQITDGGGAYILGWAGDNVLYQQNHALWTSSSDGKIKNKLADLGIWYILNTAISRDGNKVFYYADNRSPGQQAQSKAFSYDSKTGKVSEIATIADNNFAANLSISRDSNFFGYTISGIVNAPSITIDLTTNSSAKLCESSCYYSIWQN